MTIDYQTLRLDGIYKQNQQGQLMLRVKIPAGVLSSEQAHKIADLAEHFAGARLHLTCRGSIEFHDLAYPDLAEVTRGLAAVGLTSRGACGGAVRGVSCSSTFGENFATVQALARKLHRHFAGNPYFEGLPKKFKISVDGDYTRSRHLIQDVGLVRVGRNDTEDLYDIWVAGGLGREPQAAIRFEEGTPESRLIPVIEAVLRVYLAHGEKGKRLKHLLNSVGEERFRRLVRDETGTLPAAQTDNGLGHFVAGTSQKGQPAPLIVAVFAGELQSRDLRHLGDLANRFGDRFLALTADQDIALFPPDRGAAEQLKLELAASGPGSDTRGQNVTFRICPGSHECRMGLAPTRDLARTVIAALSPDAREKTWAISGCPNSCSQPQLADYGIITRKMVKNDKGEHSPRFDLTRRSGDGLGQILAEGLDVEALRAFLADAVA